mgnify:FL=1|tara:strand:+ start:90 stop:311 length:222 start_codon:yes stop_codon:yes gene_type:complete
MTPEELKTLYKTVFSSEDGVRVLNDMASRFSMHSSTFSSEPTETAYREGQRTVVLFLLQMIADQKKPEEIENE